LPPRIIYYFDDAITAIEMEKLFTIKRTQLKQTFDKNTIALKAKWVTTDWKWLNQIGFFEEIQ